MAVVGVTMLWVSALPRAMRAQSASTAATRATIAKPAGVIGPPSHFPYRPGVDVEHYDNTVTLPHQGTVIRATSVVTVRRAATVRTLQLDLIGMTVDRVAVNGRRRSFSQDSATLRVPLRASDGSRVAVSVTYHGSPTDGLIIREDSTRGWSAFGDNWPNRARHWLPTVDHPSDKATVQWTVSAPASRAVIANGVRSARPVASGRRVTTFRMTDPIPTYLMVLGAAAMQETPLRSVRCVPSANASCLPQSVWTFAAERDFLPGPFAEAGRIVSTLARLVGPFPYGQLSHVQSLTKFGGMENATAIFYSDNAFRNRTLSVGLVAHETAHQWFGDAVTPRRWPDVWLSEGFASYLDPLYTKLTLGDSAFRASMRRIRDEIIAAPVVEQRPVVDSVGAETPLALLNENSYQKGAFVLHMLRAEVGDSAFFRGLRDYQRRYRHATATTDDFRAVMEKRHGVSLAPFFAQWLHRPGWAELNMRWRYDEQGKQLLLAVTQGTRFPPFAVPLTLVVRDAGGREAIVRVDLAASGMQQVRVSVPGIGTPASVVVDPDVLLLARVAVARDDR